MPTKYYQNISKGIKVIERTSFCLRTDRRTDRRTDGRTPGWSLYPPILFGSGDKKCHRCNDMPTKHFLQFSLRVITDMQWSAHYALSAIQLESSQICNDLPTMHFLQFSLRVITDMQWSAHYALSAIQLESSQICNDLPTMHFLQFSLSHHRYATICPLCTFCNSAWVITDMQRSAHYALSAIQLESSQICNDLPTKHSQQFSLRFITDMQHLPTKHLLQFSLRIIIQCNKELSVTYHCIAQAFR